MFKGYVQHNFTILFYKSRGEHFRNYLNEINLREIDFRVESFSRMPKSKCFAWIDFRGRQNLHLKKLLFVICA